MTKSKNTSFAYLNTLRFTAPAVAALLLLLVFVTHTIDRLNWRSYYEPVIQFGSSCQYQVHEWPGSFDAALAGTQGGQWTPFAMPHRGKEHPPRAFANQFLATRCFIGPVAAGEEAHPRVNLGRLYGDSNVYVEGVFATKVDSASEGKFDLSPEKLKQQTTIVVISKGIDDGGVGMATLRPPYLAVHRGDDALITRFDHAVYIEHPSFRIGLMAVLLVLLYIVWRSGLAHADVVWMLNWSAVLMLTNAIQYSFQFDLPSEIYLQRIAGGLNMASYCCLCGYVLAYVFREKFRRWQQLLLFGLAIGYAVASLVVSELIFFDLRMMTQMPGRLGSMLLCGATMHLVYQWFHLTDAERFLRDRLRYGVVMSGCAAFLIFVQAYLDDRHGIYIDGLVQVLLIGINVLYLANKMAARQNEYFAERRLRFAEQERNQWAKTVADAAGFVAHDLQRPFAILTEFVRQVEHQQGKNVDMLLSSFQTAIRSAEQEARLLIDDLTRLRPDQAERLSPEVLAEVVDDAVQRMQKLFPQGQISIHMTSQDRVLCDRRNFARVLQNIWLNALEAAGSDCKITVSERRHETSGEVEIAIHNTGSFIPAEVRERIFEAGFTSGKTHGSGLGLAYAAQVLKQCGGRIRCESSESDGTTFRLILPILPEASTMRQAFSRVAVVDDDLFVGLAWQQKLQDVGVEHYASPELFLETLSSAKKYQIVILDFNFSNSSLTGLDVARAVKQHDDCIIIVLSTAQSFDGQDLQHAGIDLVIDKKVLSPSELQATLKLFAGTRNRK